MELFYQKLKALCDEWKSSGPPSREKLMAKAEALQRWKSEANVAGLWSEPPLLLTATLDDGIGQGIEIINNYSKMMGFQVLFMGLMKSPDAIIDTCRREKPAILGLTVLQMDSEDALAHIGRNLPSKTKLIAGGPAFQYDPQMAARCGVSYVAKNIVYFVDYVLGSFWPLRSS